MICSTEACDAEEKEAEATGALLQWPWKKQRAEIGNETHPDPVLSQSGT